MASASVLRGLQYEEIRQAFDKARSTVQIPGIKLVTVTPEYYDKALVLGQDHFVKNEVLCKAFGIQWSDEMKERWLKSFQYNLSLMFLNEQDDDPVAILRISVVRAEDKMNLDNFSSGQFKELWRFIIHCNENANFFEHFGITEALSFDVLVVAEKYQSRGLATRLVKIGIEIMRNFGIDSVYIKAESPSKYSQKIFLKTGFETLYEQRFDTWIVDGQCPIRDTGEHSSMVIYGMKV